MTLRGLAALSLLVLLACGTAFAGPQSQAKPTPSAEQGSLRQHEALSPTASTVTTPPDNVGAAEMPILPSDSPNGKTTFTGDAQDTLAHHPAVTAALAALLVIDMAILGLVWWIAHNQEDVGQLKTIEGELAKLRGPHNERPTLVDIAGALIADVDRLLQEREQSRVEMGRMRVDIAALQQWLERQSAETRRPLVATRTALTGEPSVAPAAAPVPPPQPPAPRLPDLAAVENAYRAVLPTKSRSQFQAFVDTYRAVGVSLDAGGQALRFDQGGSSPYLQAVEVDGGYFALFPGADVVVSFATTYSSQLSMPGEISLAFDLGVDGTRALALTQAAIWRSDGAGGLAPARRGRVAGLVS